MQQHHSVKSEKYWYTVSFLQEPYSVQLRHAGASKKQERIQGWTLNRHPSKASDERGGSKRT